MSEELTARSTASSPALRAQGDTALPRGVVAGDIIKLKLAHWPRAWRFEVQCRTKIHCSLHGGFITGAWMLQKIKDGGKRGHLCSLYDTEAVEIFEIEPPSLTASEPLGEGVTSNPTDQREEG